MNNLSDNFTRYEEAIELNALGFNDGCIAHYEKVDNEIKLEIYSLELSDAICTAPLYQQAFRFFREKHKLYVTIEHYYDSNNSLMFNIVIWSEDNEIIYDKDGYSAYEEAQLACLKKLIEIAKNK
jgi:hypothetical protein